MNFEECPTLKIMTHFSGIVCNEHCGFLCECVYRYMCLHWLCTIEDHPAAGMLEDCMHLNVNDGETNNTHRLHDSVSPTGFSFYQQGVPTPAWSQWAAITQVPV